MAITNNLPAEVTKDTLFKAAQERFNLWAQKYADPNVSVVDMYEELSCSIYCGSPADDFVTTPRYKYKDGACSFVIDGCEFEVADLRNMRKSKSIDTERYYDICTLMVSYLDNDNCFISELIPDAWLFGSTSEEFNEGELVHSGFVEAAQKYITKFGGAFKLRKAQIYDD